MPGTITLNAISEVSTNQSFTISGLLSGYSGAPMLQYSDGANLWNNLPSNSTVTANAFSFLHPGLRANPSAIVSIRDANDISTQVNSATFAVVAPTDPKTITVDNIGGPYPEQASFEVQGQLDGYDYSPPLEFRDNAGSWNALPQNSIVSSTGFTFSHPGMAARSGNTITVRDGDFPSVQGTSSPFDISIVLRESNQGAFLTAPDSDSIYSEDLTAFNLTSSSSFGLQVTIDGVTDNTTANVAMLLYWNHTIYYQNTSGNFFSKLNTSNVWRQVTDPRVAVAKSCSIQLPSEVTANVQFPVGGSLVGYTVTPQLQYQDNLGEWHNFPPNSTITNAAFSFAHPGVSNATAITVTVRDKNIVNVNAQGTAPVVKAAESPEAAVAYPGTTQVIVDSLGNYWGLSSDNKVTFNGVVDNSTTQALLLYYNDHVIYYQSVDQSWFKRPNVEQQWLLTTSPYLNSPASDSAKIQAATQSINVLISQLSKLLRRLQPNEVID